MVRLSLIVAAALATSTPSLAAAPTGDAAAASTRASHDALRVRIADLERRVGDGQGPATRRACKTNSAGVCIYRARDRGEVAPQRRLLSADEVALVTAYEVFLADEAGAGAAEAGAYRYYLARLLAEAGETTRARPHLELLTDGSDAGPRAAWAAVLLVDCLVREWTAADLAASAQDAAGRALGAALARLRALPLWQADAAAELRAAAPRLEAGVRWTSAFAHLEAGRAAPDPDAAAAEFAACAADFEALYADTRDSHDRADSLLWNAARCRDAAYEVGRAQALRAALVTTFPESEYVAEALFELAAVDHQLARYDEAVAWYERFAAAYKRDTRIPEALARVVELRRALGPRDRLAAAFDAYEGFYVRRDPARAAAIRWAAYPAVPADERAARAHVEGYLRDYATKGPLPLRLVVEAELARLLIHSTCPKEHAIGSLCLRRAPGRARRGRPPAKRPWALARRAGADHDDALRHAAATRALARHPALRRAEAAVEDSASGRRDHEDAVAAAALIEADAAFEALVDGRAQPPRRGALGLTPEELPSPGPRTPRPRPPPSLAALAGLSDPLVADVDAVDGAYAAIAALVPESPAAVQARARQGLLREWLADRALAAPGSPARTQALDALQAAALGAYRRCLAPTSAALAARESVEVCERGVAALTLGDPGVVHEIFGPVGAESMHPAASGPDVVGVITDGDEALRVGARQALAEHHAD